MLGPPKAFGGLQMWELDAKLVVDVAIGVGILYAWCQVPPGLPN